MPLARSGRTGLCAAFCATIGVGAFADPDITNTHLTHDAVTGPGSDYGFRNGSFIAAPIPFSTPTIGSGLSLLGGYLFDLGGNTETSYIGLGALRSDNDSEAYGASGKFAFPSGWTFDVTVAEADLRYDLFVGPLSFPLEQDGVLASGGVSRSVFENWDAGLSFRYLDTDVRADFTGSLPVEILPDAALELMSVGLTLNWDVRDDTDYPTRGARLTMAANQGFELGGASRDYTYVTANFDHYSTVGDRSVVAARASTCLASDDAPFFDKCSIGFSDAFRGFSPTRYYDNRLFSAQIEFRQRFGERVGAVVFGGLGWTGADFGGLGDEGTRAAGGVGLRYRLSRKFPVDFSVDYSTNNESEEFLYIFVGQRF